MTDLLKAFDSYNEFERKSFFALTFDTIASELLLETPLVGNEKNMTKVLELIGLDGKAYQAVFKNWTTEDSNNADFSKDYAYEYLFKDVGKKSMVWLSLTEDTLYVEFLFDCTDKVLEKWVIDTNHKLRQKFGLSRTPTFKVLTKKRSGFETEDVKFDEISVDVSANYNDDFLVVDKKIQESFENNGSGLILFHGIPGTGKTTYIKHLISSRPDSNFIFVQNEFIAHLLEPDFISFLLRQRNSILIIEDAEKVLKSRTHLREDSFVSTILQLTDGLFSDYLNIKIICTFNISLTQIDSALLRKGRMLAKYEFKPLAAAKTSMLLKERGVDQGDDALTIAEIYNYSQQNFREEAPKKIGF